MVSICLSFKLTEQIDSPDKLSLTHMVNASEKNNYSFHWSIVKITYTDKNDFLVK